MSRIRFNRIGLDRTCLQSHPLCYHRVASHPLQMVEVRDQGATRRAGSSIADRCHVGLAVAEIGDGKPLFTCVLITDV
jgi:hypothetical protein